MTDHPCAVHRGRRADSRSSRRRPVGDGGSVAVLVTFIVLTAGTLVTFLVDAGAQIQAANRADTYSAEAARAATIAVGPIPTGGPTDATAAATAARAYLGQAHAVGTDTMTGTGTVTGTVTVTGPATVVVSVTVTVSTPMLGIRVSRTRTHTAQLQVGVHSGEDIS